MSKFYDETMQSLLQAVEISKGTIPIIQVENMPAKTFRALASSTQESVPKDTNKYFEPFKKTTIA